MKTFECDDANKLWYDALQSVSSAETIQESRDQPTIELLHVGMELTDPRRRWVFSRPINPAFAIVEVVWIMSGSRDLQFLQPWNPRMEQWSDDGKIFHGAYGWRLREHFGIDQLRQAYNSLVNVSHSRQVVLQIWDADTDLPFDGTPRSKDIPCNITSHLTVRNGKLDWLQVMRSNDIIWGLPYNIVQWTMLQEIMAGWLDVEVGSYVHISDSLHVYHRHWEEIGAIKLQTVTYTPPDLRLPYGIFHQHLGWCRDLIEDLAACETISDIHKLMDNRVSFALTSYDGIVPEALKNWHQLMEVVAAERVRRIAGPEEALDYAANIGSPYWQLFGNWVKSKHEEIV